jgi:hypothetical protein
VVMKCLGEPLSMNTALTDPKEIVMKNPDLKRTRSVVQVKSLSHEKKKIARPKELFVDSSEEK